MLVTLVLSVGKYFFYSHVPSNIFLPPPLPNSAPSQLPTFRNNKYKYAYMATILCLINVCITCVSSSHKLCKRDAWVKLQTPLTCKWSKGICQIELLLLCGGE